MSSSDRPSSSRVSAELQGIGMTSQRTRDRLVARLREERITNEQVLDAIRNIPRHIFVEEAMSHRAYEDTALPIGHGQTISQPYVVAVMTEALLAGGPLKKVLEIGTGSGYQTALLSRLVNQVYTIERIRTLQQKARERLRLLQFHNVRYRSADGALGWKEDAPFDGILVTAAPNAIPQALTDQLAEGGRLIVPVGGDGVQELVQITRTEQGFQRKVLQYVRFVPLLSGVTNE